MAEFPYALWYAVGRKWRTTHRVRCCWCCRLYVNGVTYSSRRWVRYDGWCYAYVALCHRVEIRMRVAHGRVVGPTDGLFTFVVVFHCLSHLVDSSAEPCFVFSFLHVSRINERARIASGCFHSTGNDEDGHHLQCAVHPMAYGSLYFRCSCFVYIRNQYPPLVCSLYRTFCCY